MIIKDTEATRAEGEKKIIADTESVVQKQIHTPEGICWASTGENNGKEMLGILCLGLASVLLRRRDWGAGEALLGGRVLRALCLTQRHRQSARAGGPQRRVKGD